MEINSVWILIESIFALVLIINLFWIVISSLIIVFIIDKESIIMRKYGFFSLLFDFILTMATGGLWLIWILIRYLRTH